MADLILGSPEHTSEVVRAVEKSPDKDRETVPVLLDRTGTPAAANLTPTEQKRHHRVREHMEARRQRKASSKALLQAKLSDTAPLTGVNLRDVGAVAQGPMRVGKVFRSSELLSKEEMRTHGIQTILDLRRMDRPCKKAPSSTKVAESTKTIFKYLLLGPKKLVPEKRLLYVHRAHPQLCTVCHNRAELRYRLDLKVIHADLIPSTVGLRIFQAMPAKVQAKALFMACTGKGAASVMAPAVANPLLLGYSALYRTLLEDSKRGMAMALRPFTETKNYPILVHCIHGKDRTGLIIMLLLMLCDVSPEAIVDDYVLSETVLRESRMHDELRLDVYLTSDDVIAATRDTMEQTIAYINEKYDSAAGYMHEIGMEDWEIANIRDNLKQLEKEETAAAPQPAKPRFGLHSFLPFTRRVSAPSVAKVPSRRRSGSSTQLPAAPSHNRASSLDDRQASFVTSAIPQLEEAVPNPIFRRASLANSGPAEIREMMRLMREQHPELGPVSEELPVDFLRDSPSPDNSMTKMGRLQDEGQRSAEKQSPEAKVNSNAGELGQENGFSGSTSSGDPVADEEAVSGVDGQKPERLVVEKEAPPESPFAHKQDRSI